MAYRDRFHQDMLIDLVGYRRHGHNEGDEPAYTQPLMYERIKTLPSVRELYARALVREGVLTQEEADRQASEAYQRLVDIQQGFKANRAAPSEPTHKLSGAGVEVETGLAAEFLVALNDQLLTWPEGFTVHPKLKKQLERRRAAMGPEGGIDWAHAEALALASLLTEGVPCGSPARTPSAAPSASGTSCCTTCTPASRWRRFSGCPARSRRSSCTTAR